MGRGHSQGLLPAAQTVRTVHPLLPAAPRLWLTAQSRNQSLVWLRDPARADRPPLMIQLHPDKAKVS